jgi:hypothetical protein
MGRVLLLGSIAILGVAVGFGLALLLLRPNDSSDLGARALAKVSKDFVAYRRTSDGITFFDHPKPYGAWLCRVNSYFVPQQVLTAKIVQQQDPWTDNLDVRRRFGVWRRPSLGPASDAAGQKACAEFRDFDHLFGVDGSADPERGPYILDRLLTLLSSGKLNIPLSCLTVDARGQPSNCNARTVLKSLSLKNLESVDVASEQQFDGGARHTDTLWMHPDGRMRTYPLGVEIVSDQHFGKQSIAEGDIRSVKVIIP